MPQIDDVLEDAKEMTEQEALGAPVPAPCGDAVVHDAVVPGTRWEFDGDVAAAFDDMLRRSIPQHDLMRRLCFDLGSAFVEPKTAVVDLGCSRGEAMAPFVARFGAQNVHVGVEASPPMLAAARERFRGLIACGVVQIRDDDLRHAYPPFQASLTLAVLTLQFVPIEHRARVLHSAWSNTVPGGALVLVEKVLGCSEPADRRLRERYWAMKEENGYSKEDVARKALALEGVLVPVTSRWNEDMLSAAGWHDVECFWRVLNFAGWLAVKR